MKIPLGYQISEFDCCPTTFINGIKYLFERRQVPGDLIKVVYNNTLDRINGHGTTREATKSLVFCLNEYSKSNNFDLECMYYEGEVVNTELFREVFSRDNVIVIRLWSLYEHYVLLTNIDDEYIYLFDPYYDLPLVFKDDDSVGVNLDNTDYNRVVKIDRLDLVNNELDYTLGEESRRECVVMRRK